MDRRGGSAELAALGVRWRRWTAIVALFARRRRGRSRVDPRAYRALHGDLTARCRSLAEGADGPSREFGRRLEVLALPWLDPGAFAKADRAILDDLLARCRRAEGELRERARDPAAPGRRALVTMASAAVAGLFVLAMGVDPGWSPVPARIRGWSGGTACLILASIVAIPASLATLRLGRRR
jgi:hypothetical protein